MHQAAKGLEASQGRRGGGWFRFSLKSLIVLTLVCGCLLGWVAMRLQRGWGQAEAVNQLLIEFLSK